MYYWVCETQSWSALCIFNLRWKHKVDFCKHSLARVKAGLISKEVVDGLHLGMMSFIVLSNYPALRLVHHSFKVKPLPLPWRQLWKKEKYVIFHHSVSPIRWYLSVLLTHSFLHSRLLDYLFECYQFFLGYHRYTSLVDLYIMFPRDWRRRFNLNRMWRHNVKPRRERSINIYHLVQLKHREVLLWMASNFSNVTRVVYIGEEVSDNCS